MLRGLLASLHANHRLSLFSKEPLVLSTVLSILSPSAVPCTEQGLLVHRSGLGPHQRGPCAGLTSGRSPAPSPPGNCRRLTGSAPQSRQQVCSDAVTWSPALSPPEGFMTPGSVTPLHVAVPLRAPGERLPTHTDEEHTEPHCAEAQERSPGCWA